MFRAFIVLIEIILLVIVLRSSAAQYLFEDMQDAISEWLVDISKTAERHQLSELREAALSQMKDLSIHQIDYVNTVTHDKASIKRFNTLYCIKKDLNPFMYGGNLKILCKEISTSKVLID